MSGPRDEAREIAAAEHVLGVGDAKAREAARDRAAAEPAFAADIEQWELRLAALALDIAPVAPSAEVWRRIEQSTGGNVTPLPRRARPEPADDTMRRLRFWKAWAAGASGLAAASLMAVTYLALPAFNPRHEMVAKVMTTDGKPDIVLAYDTASRSLMVTPVGAMPPPGMSPRVWMTHADGTVTPMGEVDMAHPRRLALNAIEGKALERAQGVVVSLEPAERPPGPRPSGPLVAAGRFKMV